MTHNRLPVVQEKIEVRRIGHEGQPVIIIDDFLDAPAAIVAAARTAPFAPPPGGAYPGLNAPLPRPYIETVVEQMRPLLAEVYDLPIAASIDLMGYYGLATQNADSLLPVQTVPHIDAIDPLQLALVHYLFEGALGGTGFFRQNATGFETVTAPRLSAYRQSISDDLKGRGPLRHVHAGTSGYTLTGDVSPSFNRLVIYPSNLLHSGLLPDHLDAALERGRLTANCFVRPKQMT